MKGKEIGNFDICLKWIMGFFSPKQELELAEAIRPLGQLKI